MYELYKNYKTKAILIMTGGIICMLMVIPVIWFTEMTFFYKFLCTLVWLVPSKTLFNTGFIKVLTDPYERLNKCYSDSPVLKDIYEKEFKNSKGFNNKLWVSQHYLFIREPNEFKVFPLSNLSEINVNVIKRKKLIIEKLTGKSLNEIYFPERYNNFGKINLDISKMETSEILKTINNGISANT